MIEQLEDRFFLTGTPRQFEYLDRGVVATRSSSTAAFISWRSLVSDVSTMSFNVYRSTNGGAAVKLNSSPLTAGTNYTDNTTSTVLSQPNAYYVKPVISGVEQAASPSYTLPANSTAAPFFTVPIRNIGNYAIKHMNMADLNGDGKYDYIIDRKPINVVNEVATESTKIEAYLNDGTFLWSVDLGPGSYDLDNIEPGPTAVDIGNWDGVVAYDLNGDDRAEVFLRSAHGLTFGDGKVVNNPGDPEVQYMSVLDGMTGAEISHVPLPTDFRIDGPLAASLAVGYLDGVHPSLVAKLKNREGSGSFHQIFTAYDFDGTSITQKWKYISAPVDSDNGHNIRVVDVDGNGTDEIADTAQVINGDGSLKYNMRDGTPSLGHGDRFYIGDFDPARPGLEYYGVQQNNPGLVIEYYADAATGQVLYAGYASAVTDNGRGEIGDIDPAYPGAEFWSFYGLHNEYNSTHTQLGTATPWPSLGLQWDGDLQAEVLSTDHAVIDQWVPASQATGRVATLYNMGSGATTADGWPIYYGDVIGDWREEVVYENGTRDGLVVFSTSTSTSTRLYTLSQNPLYRNNMTTKGYLQTRTLDYYLGGGMTTPPTPNVLAVSPSTAPTVAVKAAATANPVTGTTVNLSVLGADDGGQASLTYTWSVTDLYGNAATGLTFSANGTNAAKVSTATFTKSGSYIFTVMITDTTGKTAKSNVLVTVNQALTSISINPAAAIIGGDSNQQFVATGLDQFGLPLASQPTYTWSIFSGAGSIDSTGTYTPTGSSGSAVVKAQSGAISSTATVNFSGTTLAAPTNLVATAVSASQINLTWTDSVAGETGFLVESSSDGVNFSALATVAANSTKYNVTNLSTNSIYYFRIRSRNVNGLGLPTSIVNVTTLLVPLEWLKFDESAGTNAADSSGNGRYATTRNDPTWTTGRTGNALNFDGTNDYLEMQNNLQSTTTGSVSMWVKTSSNFSDYAILYYMSSDTYGNGLGSQQELQVNFTSAEKIQLFIQGSPAGSFATNVSLTSSASYANNAWHHVVATWTAGTDATLYVDGVAVATQSWVPTVTWSNSQRTFLGRTNLNTNLYKGAIDDVQLFSTALTAAQVQSLATANLAPTIATAPVGSPNPVSGTQTTLSVLGADDAGELGLTYTWSIAGTPPAPVTFSASGTNAAKSTTATFTQAGTYNIQVTATDAAGLSATQIVAVTVAPGTFTGSSDSDIYRVRANGLNDEIYLNDVLNQTILRSQLNTLTFNLADGNDSLIIDYTTGDPTPTGGISYIGGNGADTLEIRGSNSLDVYTMNSAQAVIHGSTTANFTGVDLLKLASGRLNINANLGAIGLQVAGSTAVASLTKDQVFSSVAISNGATVTSANTNSALPAFDAGSLAIDNATLNIFPNGGLSGVSQFSSVTITGTGKLNLRDNDLVIRYGAAASPIAQINTYVKNGLTLLGGTGYGIGSTEVDSQSTTGTILAVTDDGDPLIGGAITAISGFAIPDPAHSVVIKYTWFGDNNFDGGVDGSDYALLDSGFTSGGSLGGWVFGDYDFNGAVDGSDYALIDTGFISQSTIL